MIYAIENTLRPLEPASEERPGAVAAVLSWEELVAAPLPEAAKRLQPPQSVHFCKAEAHPGCFAGSFCIPLPLANAIRPGNGRTRPGRETAPSGKGNRNHGGTTAPSDRTEGTDHRVRFTYLLAKDWLVFADDSGCALALLERLRRETEWEHPSPGQVFCGFLEALIAGGLTQLEELENRLIRLEDGVLFGGAENFSHRLISLRKEITACYRFYSQLTELAAVLEIPSGEEALFTAEDCRLLQLFSGRVGRLREETLTLREHSMQVWEAYQAQIDLRQNKIMRILTIVTTVFLPLSLITGWYGMNFEHMPELHWRFGYPLAALLAAAVALFCIWLFKKKKFW